jgi:hypothetical protein
MWWVKDAPVRVPLVTTNANPATIAALSDPGTQIIFGEGSGREVDFRAFAGGRVTVGGWLSDEQRLGVEASGFLLERRNFIFSASSAGGTAPVVSIPFNATQPFNFNPAGETSLNAGGAPNNVTVSMTSRLWGAEANALWNLHRGEAFQLTALAGFRYLDLQENLTLTDTFADPFRAGGAVIAVDGFGARNQFYGGTLGARAVFNAGRWNLDLTGTVALGSNHETVRIAGGTTVVNNGFGFANGTTPGAVFAQRSNIGETSRDVFAVVPEVNCKFGYFVTPNFKPFVGYNFLYLNSAVRPGNQIDRNINPTQNAFFVPPGAVIGPAVPVPTFRSSDYWAQGLTFGMEFRY